MLDPVLLDGQGPLEDQITESVETGGKVVIVSGVNVQPPSSSVKYKMSFIVFVMIVIRYIRFTEGEPQQFISKRKNSEVNSLMKG